MDRWRWAYLRSGNNKENLEHERVLNNTLIIAPASSEEGIQPNQGCHPRGSPDIGDRD